MIDNGNGTFTIKNTQTGESKIVGANELGNYGLSTPQSPAFAAAQQNQQTQQNKPGMLEDLLNKSGAYNVPFLGGLLGRGVAEPIAKGAELVGEAARSVVSPNQKTPTFMSGQDYQNLTGGDTANALRYGAGQGLSTGLAVAGARGIPSIPQDIKNIPNALGFLTKGGIGKKIGEKVAQSTASGVTDPWNDFATEVKQAVTQKLGKGSEYQDIVNSRLNPEVPASLDPNPQITPSDLLGFRQQAANRIPQGIFAKFNGKSPSDQVDEIIRQVATSRLKDLAGTKNLDKLYSIYSKFGSPAENAVKGGAVLGASQLLPDKYREPAIGAVLGGGELMKMLGIIK